jgi:deoxyribodipyrimidine photolyase-related protein
MNTRHLILVLGDQLDAQASAFDDFDPQLDAVWMAEVLEESTHVPSSKQRIALFLSAMRHFSQALQTRGIRVHYQALNEAADADLEPSSLGATLARDVALLQPQKIILTAPGDWRVWKQLKAVAAQANTVLEVRDDRHFYSTVADFKRHAQGRKQLRMEYWYREQRKRHGVLMQGDQPLGGQWNFDAENRQSFGKNGPQNVPSPAVFAPDDITHGVLRLVNQRFAAHPGQVDQFAWPVTPEQAQQTLAQFVRERLPHFGQYQDAMWTGQAWLYHAHLSAALNLKLIDARTVVNAVTAAYDSGHAPLSAVEGFVRQVLGWREYVRGVYWTQMPAYAALNTQEARANLPNFFWTGQTDMACLHETVQQSLTLGYAHHIQRLMVTGLYGLMFGVEPQQMHAWYLSVYVDAVEWVELPNTLGMSQYADGGIMASKPYVASGKYIQRMSNYCTGCRFKPDQSTGDAACPFTTLYWDYLIQHQSSLRANPRMSMQLKNLQRLDDEQVKAIQAQALAHRQAHANPAYSIG